jgi:hypothetical protein
MLLLEPMAFHTVRVVGVSESRRHLVLRLSGGRLVLCTAEQLPDLPPATILFVEPPQYFQDGVTATLSAQTGETFVVLVSNGECNEDAAAHALDDAS